jgi:mono/diheme cytochrome c family protein
VASPQLTVTASVADAGVTASVSILPPPVGDPDAGAHLFQDVLLCNGCHGPTGNGSPPVLLADGGLVLLDGGPVYLMEGQEYPYPAPGLNAAPGSGNLAADPAWNAALFSIAAQSDMDNKGVALRLPMPIWVGASDGTGKVLNAQSFADIYAWLRTQTR